MKDLLRVSGKAWTHAVHATLRMHAVINEWGGCGVLRISYHVPNDKSGSLDSYYYYSSFI